ncbi:sensor histidine kinase [Streptomyces sp. VRA16 Mangrove soil]|uniref:sensor histidine kinase n=1 Tax=Streptomyces sp. VRA16 Mangrove soil TaxID=2817434 RepID=UPI001A9E1A8E|nr:sensor histidine kinase [Streptomyces sp. VRA16 Mangrove soil]MBO1333568.1 sensor histidine kinase [Streptomyces sp. VRA16 Mangrove soil]
MTRQDLAETTRRALSHPDLPLTAAVVLTVLALVELLGPRTPDDLLGPLALALATTVPLAFLRPHPVLTAATVTTATLLAPPAYDRLFLSGLPALAAALYTVGRQRTGRTTLAFAAPFAGYALAGGAYGTPLLVGAALALTAGHARRTRAEQDRRTAVDWAHADTALAHAALGERARIARELHDIVAHHISTLSVQAETARYTTPGLPPEGAEKFLAIGDTARLALTEMRRLLGVLREDVPEEAARARVPQPGLDQLLALVDEARETSGGAVRLIVRGPVTPLDPGLELTAYRIVQEALTNARRHAQGVAVDVELHYGEEELRLRIRDCGPGTSTADPVGHGLLGMRERTAMAGGTLHTGPAPAGGFLVEAVLPVRTGTP